MSAPGPIMELIGKTAFAFDQIQPLLPTYTHLLVSALFPIYAGAHSSLTRPASAAKPPKRKKHADDESAEDNKEEEDNEQKMEGLSPSDALMFPIMAGVTLTGLYFLIKWMDNAELLNKILNGYFAFFAIFSVSRFITDGLDFIHCVVFPRVYRDQGLEYEVHNSKRNAIPADSNELHKQLQAGRKNDDIIRTSPLPGALSRFLLPTSAKSALWAFRRLPYQKWTVKTHIHGIFSARAQIGLHGVLGFLFGLAAVAWFNFVSKPWFLTNLLGFAFSYGAMQLLSPTTFGTGTLLLSALFFYDIYMVFFTPMMVTVAKSLDIPIKLVFPRPSVPSPVEGRPPIKQHAMLGLGDVVIPGIMIGLALRFDLYMFYLRKQRRVEAEQDKPAETQKAKYVSVSNRWGEALWNVGPTPGSFPRPYFRASLVGYVLGMLATLAAMQIANHAQPALLYLVPGVLLAIWGTALVRGEVKDVWNWSEADEDTEEQGDAKDKKDASSRKSIFSAERTKDMEHRLEKAAGKYVEVDETSTAHDDDDDAAAAAKNEKRTKAAKHAKKRNAASAGPDRTLFAFSITAPFALSSPKRRSSNAADASAGADNDDASSRPSSSGSSAAGGGLRRRNWQAGTPGKGEGAGVWEGEGEVPIGKRRRTS
ncbi:uncharacterized protein K452DRAFT_293392 [Aplosporella prunicola CBS 121167]|uniref:Peptidase A22B, signal peptide peptidase n=1 Tax=Aplosporella prunicola CBS 121167 TaxID=1176127 RepID=A0A6A6ATC9_9PEZI|nr:uncharacterized protein K452DRAFT_293392 [Aplosporella prunicola CBS 121167]KAF2135219.1 hypothetical protein K452DRAFT_293392 [Aplosporella prunicola CBS 121167]